MNIEYFGEYALTQNSVLVGFKEKTEKSLINRFRYFVPPPRLSFASAFPGF